MQAIQQDFLYLMYYDNLPVWGQVGKIDPATKLPKLFTHSVFNIRYNKEYVVGIKLETPDSGLVDISEKALIASGGQGLKLKFTYEVNWIPDNTEFENRLQTYEKISLDPMHIDVRLWGGGGAVLGMGWCFVCFDIVTCCR